MCSDVFIPPMAGFTCVAFKPDADNMPYINLMLLLLTLAGFEAFWFTTPQFRAPGTRTTYPAWLLYTDAPVSVVMSLIDAL